MFNLNGVGKLYFDSLFAKDYSVVLAILILIVFFSLVGNLLMALGWGSPIHVYASMNRREMGRWITEQIFPTHRFLP